MAAELPPGVRLRGATTSDLAHITRVLQAGSIVAGDVESQVERFFVAEAPGGCIGVIALECFGGDALLRSLCIDPAWRGRGVASNLVEHVLTEAALEAMDSVYLLTHGAERFFARFGFIVMNRTELPFTVSRAAERAGSTVPDATVMLLGLAEP